MSSSPCGSGAVAGAISSWLIETTESGVRAPVACEDDNARPNRVPESLHRHKPRLYAVAIRRTQEAPGEGPARGVRNGNKSLRRPALGKRCRDPARARRERGLRSSFLSEFAA